MIPYLNRGDKIAITCPAKKVAIPMTDAVKLLESWGLEVVLGETVTATYNQFAGDDALRALDLQRFIDDDSIKAIIAARGGYGTVRIIDHVDFSNFARNPKWIVGFSDITVLHAHLFAIYQAQTIHGQMPVTIPDASMASLETLRKALFGEALTYEIDADIQNRLGKAEGVLIGGNLSILISILNSASDYSYDGKILFIEDISEYIYSIDRMIRCLDRAGKLRNLKGLIVGGFTDLQDNEPPFGQSVKDIIMDVVKNYDYPVCFNFPAGHIKNNKSLVLGAQVNLLVSAHSASLNFSSF